MISHSGEVITTNCYTPLCLYLFTFPAKEIAPWLVPNYTAWWQKHTCVSSLPKPIMQCCPARTCNSQVAGWKSVALPLAPPCHAVTAWLQCGIVDVMSAKRIMSWSCWHWAALFWTILSECVFIQIFFCLTRRWNGLVHFDATWQIVQLWCASENRPQTPLLHGNR